MTPSHAHPSIVRRHEALVEAAIEQQGFHATHVLGDRVNTQFSYTTGFLLAGHPELVILGLGPKHRLDLFEHLMAQVRRGVTVPVGREAANEMDGMPFRLLPVPMEHWAGRDCLLLGFASYYGPRRYPVDVNSFLQVVWPDRNLRFPWDEDAMTILCRDQPILADGDPPRRRWPVDDGDFGSTCGDCDGEPRNRAERRRQARRR